MTKLTAAVSFLLAAAGAANAGTLFSSIPNQDLFGYGYRVDIYRVATDLSSQNATAPFSPAAGRLEPEGMTFYNGVLYVSGDGSTTETNGYLAAYAGGNIGALPTAVRHTVTINTATAAYGPEAITVNTRGSGYGAFSGSTPTLVGVDSVVSPVSQRVLGAIDVTTGPVGSPIASAAFNFDDAAFVPGASAAEDRFAFVDGSPAGAPNLVYYTADASGPVATGQVFPLFVQAKGLVFIPAADAGLFIPGLNQDVLMICGGPDFAGDASRLGIFSLNGDLLGLSTLPSGTGAGRFGGIEALAWDSAGKRLFIGDENGTSSQIAVIQIPAPGAALVAGLGVLVAARRRRA